MIGIRSLLLTSFVLSLVFGLRIENAAAADERMPPRTIAGILGQLAAAKPDPSRAIENRRVLDAPAPAWASPLETWTFHFKKAWAAQQIGDSKRQVESLRLAVDAGAQLNPNFREEALIALSSALINSGKFSEAVRLREGLDAHGRSDPGRQAMTSTGLVNWYLQIGDVPAARNSLERAEAFHRITLANPGYNIWQDFYVSFLSRARGNLLIIDRRFDEAEAELRKGLDAIARDQPKAQQRVAELGRSTSQWHTANSLVENSARNWDFAESSLAGLLTRRNRLPEAELALRNALERTLKRLGRDNVLTGQAVSRIADSLHQQGRFAEAVELRNAALSIFDSAGVVPQSLRRVSALRGRGQGLAAMGRWGESLESFEAIRTALEGDPEGQAWLGYGEPNWGLALIRGGRHVEAISLLQPTLGRQVDLYGNESHETALFRGVLAIAYAKSGRVSDAFSEFRLAIPILLESSSEDGNVSPARALEVRRVLEGYVEFLLSLAPEQVPADVDSRSEAFRVADAARGRTVQRAMGQSAARAVANDPQIAVLVRREQDLEQEMQTLYDFLVRLMNVPPESRLPSEIARFQSRIAEVRAERKTLLPEIERRFPEYAFLVNPRPPTIAQARKAVRPGEAMVSILTTEEKTFVWAFAADGEVAFHAAPVGEERLTAMVRRLRRGLTLGGDGTIAPYDFKTAHDLYKILLEPVAHAWQGKSSIAVIAGGALSQIPLSILITDARALASDGKPAFAAYRDAAWLARRVAVTYAPSVSSLVRLRALQPGSAGRVPFAGFGDPVFSSGAVQAPGSIRSLHLRSLEIVRVPRGADFARQAVPWTEYAQLTPLPDTRDEILAVAKALDASADGNVFLGTEASRSRVKETNLRNRRIVMFATHGLVPGDLPGLDQPALALSALGNAGSPLLTLEDVLGLKLDADLVVLSACNTAAADGEGAEAVSGLGRGFFYAGSRALLVTHWPVETVSAKLLTTGFFERYAKDPGMTRVRALHDSMIALIDSPGTQEYSYAHPLFWGAFALIGDGGR